MTSVPANPNGLGTKRLLNRFLRLLLPVFLFASMTGLNLLESFTFRDDRSDVITRVGNIGSRAASAIDRLGPSATRPQQESVLALLLSDPAIACATLTSEMKSIIAAAPARVGCLGSGSATPATFPIHSKYGVTLNIKYNLAELEERSHLFRVFTWLVLVGSLAVAALASWFSFRQIVGKPVDALLKAIQRTQSEGQPARVEHATRDELGVVIDAFNTMQDKLREEARRNAEALRRLDYVYNETPALMFSIDSKGTILTASGHWLDETGYRREEIAGAPLSRFLRSQTPEDFAETEAIIVAASNPLRDIPLVLACKFGAQKDVLLSVVPDSQNDNLAKLCVLSDISGLRAAQTELRRQAVTDHLTGLPNRQGLFDHLSDIARTGQTEGAALLFIDLDNFKTVNDTLGHEAGDTLLKAAAGRLRHAISRKDFLARLGGDEFAIVLHGLRLPDDANVVAERIIKTFENPIRLGEASAVVGTSIGIASFADCSSTDDILRLADLAMYQSKQSGKNCATRYTYDLTAKVVSRDMIVQKIRDGLANSRFSFHLQPIVDVKTLLPVGAEALLRLNCPNDGLMSPTEIIKAAEETGLINEITRWSVAEGLATTRRAQDAAKGRPPYVAVNLSPKQMSREFIGELVNRLRAEPAVARSMVFEITETALFRQGEDVASLLETIRAAGARVALDDFGTGYSSLGHLQRFPVDLIKLDRSFVSGLSGENDDAQRRRALIRATSAMAAELGTDIVAEGIEDMATLEVLRSFNIAYGQGYLFSPPLPEQAAFEWMNRFSHGAQPSNVVPLAV
ncbi:MAG: EAL domain-containing protein [Hyphomicrobiales bacterium]